MDTSTTARRAELAPRGSVNLGGLRETVSQTRTNFTRVRGPTRTRADNQRAKPDLITFVSLACEIYQNIGDELIPMQQYTQSLETQQGQGHTSLVSHTEISHSTPSTYSRGVTRTYVEDIIIKRPRRSILEEKSADLASFVTELRVRTHAPLRSHPNIARLRGVGWDFEDEDASIPRPILVEELAPQGSMDNFWKNWNCVRMTFKSKLQFCDDIAGALHALHGCLVVHGDVKPENILVFPRKDAQNSFMVKLTDFGHSVLHDDGLETLPAFTPQWCAPEAAKSTHMSLRDMMATDCYSYGLVVSSIMIGRPFYTDLENVEGLKEDGSILGRLIDLIEKEDQNNNDSDLDIDIIAQILRKTLQVDSKLRSVETCLGIIETCVNFHLLYPVYPEVSIKRTESQADHQSSYRIHNRAKSTAVESSSYGRLATISKLDVTDKVTIGYQTLSSCSHQLKEYIATKLLAVASDTRDLRRAASCWELSICYFSGFGVPICFEKSSYWLSLAAESGVAAAQDHFHNLHRAMNRSPSINLTSTSTVSSNNIPEEDIAAPTMHAYLNSKPAKIDEPSILERIAGDESAEIHIPVSMHILIQRTMCEGSLEQLRDLIQHDAEALNSQDAHGDTAVMLAVKHQRFEMLDFLLDCPGLDTGICNRSGQTILHYMAVWEHSHIHHLVPRLVKAGADPNAEALPTQQDPSSAFTSGIPRCSILNSILHNNMILLDCLLEAAHADSFISSCRICESGSRLRKILAISLSVFQADAVQKLVTHIQDHQPLKEIDLDLIEVWTGQQLLPLYKTPFNSIIVTAMDLPEPFFRAMHYGKEYQNVLQNTIEFLLSTGTDATKKAHLMLFTAVERSCVDGVRMLLHQRKQAGTPIPWWLECDAKFSPFEQSINKGSRDIFDTFLEDNKSFLQEKVLAKCRSGSIYCYRDLSLAERYLRKILNDKRPPHHHNENMVPKALRLAVHARHQDNYFLEAILQAAKPQLALEEADSLLRRAILHSSFKAADILLRYYPRLLDTQSSRRQFRDRLRPNSLTHSYDLLQHENLSLYWALEIGQGTLIQEILFSGAYEHCRFVMKRLKLAREPKPWSQGLFWAFQRKPRNTPEEGTPAWQQCVLKTKEYHALLAGNIARAHGDRDALWAVIRCQVNQGHSTSISYLQHAVGYSNVWAVKKMLECGWKANAPAWLFFMSPLYFSTLLEQEKKPRLSHALYDILDLTGGPNVRRRPGLQTHTEVYNQHRRMNLQFGKSFRETQIKECQGILREHGGRVPWLVEFLAARSYAAKVAALVIYALLYAVTLPLVLAYTTNDVWTTMSQSQKLGFVYLLALLAVLSPPYYFFQKKPYLNIKGAVIYYATCVLFFLTNHIAIPILVIHAKWQPFLVCEHIPRECDAVASCVDYSFLLPLAFLVGEGVLAFFVRFVGDKLDWW